MSTIPLEQLSDSDVEYRNLTLQVQGRERGDNILNLSYFIPSPYPQALIFIKPGTHLLLKGRKVNEEEISLWCPIWVVIGSNNSSGFEIVITNKYSLSAN